ncbi:hypothetical protein BC792_12520 [Sphingobacterium allocomposti]|uniref:Uncharacterized protein n=1 Tax=Sphingobacterium allocomposti TaxID=415956 RepID=A0A5S5D407_9SPHI|nr:hypothetical protein BC792_12520 [Sphingobacterium composti Yoo et al. 2007 non Ten et al. 2007]
MNRKKTVIARRRRGDEFLKTDSQPPIAFTFHTLFFDFKVFHYIATITKDTRD